MKVFFELSHTSCDVEIMKSGFDFDALLFHAWDERGRRKPANATVVSEPRGSYDVAVVSSGRGFDMMKRSKVPIIWKSFVDFGKWEKPPRKILDRLSSWTALCVESVERFGMAGHPKAVAIEPGIDTKLFSGYLGTTCRALTLGHLLPIRHEKGPDVLCRVSNSIPIDVIGTGNEGFEDAGIQVLPHAESQEALAASMREYRVYFNPCGVICCSVLEAMSVGIPVVTMEPGNFRDLMRHRENCMVAKTEKEAVHWLELLLKNPGLSSDIGRAGAASVRHRFHSAICASTWKDLILNAAK